MITGRNDSIGPVLSIPIRLAPHPCWNTAISTPNAARADSAVVRAALAATTIERKAMAISTKMIPITTSRNTSWRVWRIAAMSS